MTIIKDARDSIGLQQKIKLDFQSHKDSFDPTLFHFRFSLLAIQMSSWSNAKYIFAKKDLTLAIWILQTACRRKVEFHLLVENGEVLQLL